jgi:hypothetical protein
MVKINRTLPVLGERQQPDQQAVREVIVRTHRPTLLLYSNRVARMKNWFPGMLFYTDLAVKSDSLIRSSSVLIFKEHTLPDSTTNGVN